MGARVVSHRLIAYARRAGKNHMAQKLVRSYAEQGEHVHYGLEICYNGDRECDGWVKQRFHWDGEGMVLLGGEVPVAEVAR